MPAKKKLAVSRESLRVAVGLLVSLVSVVLILSPNTFLDPLARLIVQGVGSFGFWSILPLIFCSGVYVTFKGRYFGKTAWLSLLGIIIWIFFGSILASYYGSLDSLDLVEGKMDATNAVALFRELYSSLAATKSLAYGGSLGGGYVGYFFYGLLMGALDDAMALQAVCWLVVILFFPLVINGLLRRAFMRRPKRIKKPREKKRPKASKPVDTLAGLLEEEPEEIAVLGREPGEEDEVDLRKDYDEILASRSISDLAVKSYNRTHGLVKAHYQFVKSQGESLHPLERLAPIGGEHALNAIPPVPEPAKEPVEAPPPSVAKAKAPLEAFKEPEPETADMPAPPIEENVPEPAPVKETLVQPVPEAAAPKAPKARPRPPYRLPPLELLSYHEDSADLMKNDASTAERTKLINENFAYLHVGAKVVGHTIGPSVTRFDVEMDPDSSVTSVQRIVADLAIRLGGVPIRFEPLVLNKSTSGLEVANVVRTNVGLRECLEALKPEDDRNGLEIVFGKNISGELIHANLADFPHMLVAGTTGSGKTIFLHSVIITLLLHNRPEDLKIILVDPKRVEMSYYHNLPHLLCPTISEAGKAKVALEKLSLEMERRYALFENNYVNSIDAYNKKARAEGLEPLPRIVMLVDEYADLHEACKEVEQPMLRIAQKARAAGIHLVIATQRPTVDIINGTIKSNLSTHVALMVGSAVDSITIIGEKGAEELLGNGDMLVESPLISRSNKVRVQGAFVDIEEILSVSDFIREQLPPAFDPNFLDLEEKGKGEETPAVLSSGTAKDVQEEELYELIKEDIVKREYCSISFLQRTYGIGFPKAGRLFAKLQRDGYVSSVSSSAAKGCQVLIREDESGEGAA